MRITVSNLKKQRENIITTLTKKVGKSNLKSAMNILLQSAEYEEIFNKNKTIEDTISEITNGDYFKNEKMKTADYLAELNNHNSDTYAFNFTQKNK